MTSCSNYRLLGAAGNYHVYSTPLTQYSLLQCKYNSLGRLPTAWEGFLLGLGPGNEAGNDYI